MKEDWHIKSTSRDVVAEHSGELVLEWTLNQTPEPNWIQFLITSGVPKSGSMAFIASEPRLVGNLLRVNVSAGDLEGAVTWVEQSIPIANQKFEAQVLVKRRREEAQRQEQQAAQEARLQEARARLDRLGRSD